MGRTRDMFYRALGWTVWHGGKYFLRRKYNWYLPGRFYAGAAALGVGAVALLVARNHSSDG
jgi:hypothetical protein